ncbi:hypothetical protein [Streptomyces sp. NBC_01800]|uniref:hypothetical protein n=1 Tax=Streptomyces sp. NBC_01800 TaxID=2975945 RepID=UPI002DD822A2|nr:hypothetical protein [Streptomyces sp. NBC_01800]WSA72155.1 hypothetical protein OIE65_37315 [Streptomyces sp. NBC_01800]
MSGSSKPSTRATCPPTTDAGLLGRYVSTLAFGIAVQAASGIGRDELQSMADAALEAWPPF